MKKLWVFILAGVLAAAALFIFFPPIRFMLPLAGRGVVEVITLPRDLYRERPPESLIPARAGLMIRVRSGTYIWGKLVGSRTFRELTVLPVWREEEIEERLEAARREFEDRTGFRIDRSRIMEVAGEDIALAVIPPAEFSPAALFAVARLGVRARLTEIVLRLGDSLKDDGDRILREEKYRGETVVSIPPGENFPLETAYSVIDGTLVLAVSASARFLIEEAIDLARGEGEPLGGSPEYAAALGEDGLPAATLFEFFLSPARFRGGLEEGLPPGIAAEAAAWGETLVHSLDACRLFGCRAGYRYREGIQARIRCVLREARLAEYSFPPPGRHSPLPAGEMCCWYFTADPALIGESLAEALVSLGVQEESGDFPGLGGWERESGLSVRRDILPVLGDNWSLVLAGLSGEEFLPIPPFALSNRVADREGAEAALKKAAAWVVLFRGLTPVREVYRGVEITSFPGLFFTEPGYALTDEELLIGGPRAQIEKLIDLRAGERPALENDPVFRRMISSFEPDPEFLGYLEGPTFFSSLRSAAEWYFAYQRLAPEEPLISEIAYQAKFLPLLELLRPLRRGAAALTREKNIVKIDLFLYIPGSD